MAHFATLSDYQFERQADDVRGTILRSESNEELGRVCDVVIDHATGEIPYLVTDTRYDRKVLVPVEVVAASDQRNTLQSQLAPEDLEHLPVFNESILASRDRWHDYEQLYRSVIEDVLADGAQSFAPPWTHSAKSIVAINRKRNPSNSSSWTNLADRWEAFTRQVRRELQQIRNDCGICKKSGRRIA